MRINASKTKMMLAPLPDEQHQAVFLDNEQLEDNDRFKCLGAVFLANGQRTDDVRSWISLARSAFSR